MCLHVHTLCWLVTGLKDDAGSFLFFSLTLIMISMTSAALSFAVGAGIAIYAIANILIAMSFVLMMVRTYTTARNFEIQKRLSSEIYNVLWTYACLYVQTCERFTSVWTENIIMCAEILSLVIFGVSCFLYFQIFGGLFVNIDSIWVGIRWLQYFSFFRYANNVSVTVTAFWLMMYATRITVTLSGWGEGVAHFKSFTNKFTNWHAIWDVIIFISL